jgi:low affinity Fe/Cu permease
MEHHMPHPHPRRNRFDHFAEKATQVVSGPPFFLACVLFVVLWLPTMLFMDLSASQLLVQTISAVVTLLLVALLQNSQKRYEEAVNLKLNAIAEGVADLMRERAGVDHELRDNIDRLTRTIGLEERTTTDRPSPGEAVAVTDGDGLADGEDDQDDRVSA